MEIKDLQKKKDADLHKLLAEYRGKLYDLRIKTSIQQLKKVSEVKKVKKTIARILTVLKERKGQNETS